MEGWRRGCERTEESKFSRYVFQETVWIGERIGRQFLVALNNYPFTNHKKIYKKSASKANEDFYRGRLSM